MAGNRNISVKICGNPHANSGWNPIILYNSPLFSVPDVQYVGFNANSYFFSVIIEKTQIVYKLIKNNVKSYGAFREGALVIAMSIPKGYKLDGNSSPYDVLISLKDRFVSSCMKCIDPVEEKYEFNSGVVNQNLLDDIISKYTISPYKGPYRVMNPNGPEACVELDEFKIRELLSDVQYSAFSQFKEVFVAQSCQSNNYTRVTNLQVPRVKEYSIVINGVNDGYVSSEDEVIPVKGTKDDRYYENSRVSFSINDIRSGRVPRCAVIDDENEKVMINTKELSVPRVKTVYLQFEDPGAEACFKSISYNNDYLTVNSAKAITLEAEKIDYLMSPAYFIIQFSDSRYKKTGINLIDDNLVVRTVVEPRVSPSRDKNVGRSESAGIKRLVISEINKDISNYQCYFILENGDSMYKSRLHLNKSRKDRCESRFTIPSSDFKIRNFKLVLKNTSVTYYYEGSLSSQEEILLRFNEFEKVDNYNFNLIHLILCCLVSLILGAMIMYFVYPDSDTDYKYEGPSIEDGIKSPRDGIKKSESGDDRHKDNYSESDDEDRNNADYIGDDSHSDATDNQTSDSFDRTMNGVDDDLYDDAEQESEAPKSEAPKSSGQVAPKSEAPKSEASKSEASKSEASKSEASKSEASQSGTSDTEANELNSGKER